MLNFLQCLLCLFKGQFHGVILHFLTEASTSFKGSAIYIYSCRYIIWKGSL
jgi:hypothetical protein